jgi:hypothetical protein
MGKYKGKPGNLRMFGRMLERTFGSAVEERPFMAAIAFYIKMPLQGPPG